MNEIYITTQNLIVQQKKSIPTAPQDGKIYSMAISAPIKKFFTKDCE